MRFLDSLGADPGKSRLARVTGRALTLGLLLFAVAIPHSIAAAHVGLNLALLSWIVRDLSAGKLHFKRTPLDAPLLCFIALSVLSALFSAEPRLSLPKLLTLLLFGVIYLCAANLTARGARVMLAALLVSALAGVLFSLGEKAIGRGMTVAAIAPESPLARGPLQAGDTIWMIGRDRVGSLEEANAIIRRQPPGMRLEIEALHEGDPLPLTLTVSEELKARDNPLGVVAGGPSRQFRVSGFTRHFITYADQMQILALFSFGGLLVAWQKRKRVSLWLALTVLFAAALILTASRAAFAAFLFALILVAALAAGRRVFIAALGAAVLIGGIGLGVLLATRASTTARFIDDSSSRRLGYMKAGLRLIPENPLLGVGMDSHKRHWKEWGFPGDYITHTHSTPIQIALDRGLPALGCYVWLMWTLLALSWRAHRESKDELLSILALGSFAAQTGFHASSLVNYTFGDAEVLLLVLAMGGMMLAAEKDVGAGLVPARSG